jgi:hypothetical protein
MSRRPTTKVLKELHEEGSVGLYGMAVVVKGSDGKLSVKTAAD